MTIDDLAKHLIASPTREEAEKCLPPWMKNHPIAEELVERWGDVQGLIKQRDELIALKPWKTAQYNQEFGVEVLRIASNLDDDLKDGTVGGL